MSGDQKPDTSEAVAKAIDAFTDGGIHHRESAEYAEVAIAAHNQELERLGYVTVKAVKVKLLDLDTALKGNEDTYNGYNLAIRDLQLLGLPIEVIE